MSFKLTTLWCFSVFPICFCLYTTPILRTSIQLTKFYNCVRELTKQGNINNTLYLFIFKFITSLYYSCFYYFNNCDRLKLTHTGSLSSSLRIEKEWDLFWDIPRKILEKEMFIWRTGLWNKRQLIIHFNLQRELSIIMFRIRKTLAFINRKPHYSFNLISQK